MKIRISTRLKIFLKQYAADNELRNMQQALEHYFINAKKIKPAPVRIPTPKPEVLEKTASNKELDTKEETPKLKKGKGWFKKNGKN